MSFLLRPFLSNRNSKNNQNNNTDNNSSSENNDNDSNSQMNQNNNNNNNNDNLSNSLNLITSSNYNNFENYNQSYKKDQINTQKRLNHFISEYNTHSLIAAFGLNLKCQLGISESGDKLPLTIIPFLINERVHSIAAGHDHTLFMLEDHVLYCAGSRHLTFVPNSNNENYPSSHSICPLHLDYLEENEKIIDIKADYSYSAVLTDKGNIISWRREMKKVPKPENHRFIKIASGEFIILALDECGQVSYISVESSEIKQLPLEDKIRDISGGWSGVNLLLTENGKVKRYDSASNDIIDIDVPQRVIKMFGGVRYGVFLTEERHVWVFTPSHQCIKFKPPNNSRVISASGGYQHVVILTDDGEVYCAFQFGSTSDIATHFGYFERATFKEVQRNDGITFFCLTEAKSFAGPSMQPTRCWSGSYQMFIEYEQKSRLGQDLENIFDAPIGFEASL